MSNAERSYHGGISLLYAVGCAFFLWYFVRFNPASPTTGLSVPSAVFMKLTARPVLGAGIAAQTVATAGLVVETLRH
jgi:hypothetical protein